MADHRRAIFDEAGEPFVETVLGGDLIAQVPFADVPGAVDAGEHLGDGLHIALRAGFEVRPREEFRITGTIGEIVIERGREGRVLFFDRDTPKGREIMPEGKGRGTAFGLELDDFSRTVLEGRPLAAGPEHSLGELRTALAMYRSAESRQWEKVWE